MQPTDHSNSSTPRRTARRALVGLAAAATISVGGLAATAGSASATGGSSYSATYSKWAGADWTLPGGTTVTIAGGIDQFGPFSGPFTNNKTATVKFTTTTCKVVSGADVLTVRSLSSEGLVNSGVKAEPLQGSASVQVTVNVAGTETKTPAGTGGDCNEPNPAGATTTPITDKVTTNVSWKNAPGSSPVIWSNEYEYGVYYYRDAVAKGSVKSTYLGSVTLPNTPGSWHYSGAWVYPTGT